MRESPPRFDVFQIERQIRVRNRQVVFASRRTVRGVIAADRGLEGLWPRIIHPNSIVIGIGRLAEGVGDLWAFPADMPETVVIVARPQVDGPEATTLNWLLREYWRRVFHSLLDERLSRQNEAERNQLAAAVSPDVLVEAREVLIKEGTVAYNAPDHEVVAEFAAVLLELRAFAPDAIRWWFPSLQEPGRVADALNDGLAAASLLETARPPGIDAGSSPTDPGTLPLAAVPVASAWPWSPAALRAQADRAAQRQNLVRAVLDEWRALAAEGGGEAAVDPRVDRLVGEFARRINAAIDAGDDEVGRFARLIRSLVAASGGSAWTPHARLLFDLQKMCTDSERKSYATGLFRWLLTLGRQSLTEPLPCRRLVQIHRHSVAAATRLARIHLNPVDRAEAEATLGIPVATTLRRAREAIKPRVAMAILRGGLRPGCLVEEAAFAALVEELLDAVTDRGFISFSNLRDAVSRNQLKLSDLASIAELMRGDQLLRCDLALSDSLDGAYRQAPLYLAGLQRLNAPFFGDAWGRLLSLQLLLPFGGAWLMLRGVEHFLEPLTDYSLGETWHVYTTGRMLSLGLGLWVLIHVPAVRTELGRGLRAAGAAVHFVSVVLPARLAVQPWVAAILRCLPVTWFHHHLAAPSLVTAAVWIFLPHHGGLISRSTPWVPPLVFALAATGLHTRWGRMVEDRFVEAMSQAAHHVHIYILEGLVASILDAFRQAVDVIEGMLYAVDEQLRFRSGETMVTLAVKSVLAAVWSLIDAVVRFCVTLLIEPQLNPIKHFPVVTVCHKLLVPMIPVVATQLVATTGMEKGLAFTAVTFVSTCIPGVFGFLAWELKENWRLYAENRSPTLQPMPVGRHGETVRRLLLAGFHSGTIPKLFTLLRQTARQPTTRTARAERLMHELQTDIAEFIEHEWVGLLARTVSCGGLGLRVLAVSTGVNRIRVTVAAGGEESGPLCLEFSRETAGIVSRVVDEGWLGRVNERQLATVHLALAGLHRLVGADRATTECGDLLDDGPECGRAGVETCGDLRSVRPIRWVTWRNAWECEKR